MGAVKGRPSPCLRCSRVDDPRDCDNKNCGVWRAWFIYKWDLLRTQAMPAETASEDAFRYEAPGYVRAHLQKDPCEGCLYPKDLCGSPCRTKRSWEEQRQEVFL